MVLLLKKAKLTSLTYILYAHINIQTKIDEMRQQIYKKVYTLDEKYSNIYRIIIVYSRV